MNLVKMDVVVDLLTTTIGKMNHVVMMKYLLTYNQLLRGRRAFYQQDREQANDQNRHTSADMDIAWKVFKGMVLSTSNMYLDQLANHRFGKNFNEVSEKSPKEVEDLCQNYLLKFIKEVFPAGVNPNNDCSTRKDIRNDQHQTIQQNLDSSSAFKISDVRTIEGDNFEDEVISDFSSEQNYDFLKALCANENEVDGDDEDDELSSNIRVKVEPQLDQQLIRIQDNEQNVNFISFDPLTTMQQQPQNKIQIDQFSEIPRKTKRVGFNLKSGWDDEEEKEPRLRDILSPTERPNIAQNPGTIKSLSSDTRRGFSQSCWRNKRGVWYQR